MCDRLACSSCPSAKITSRFAYRVRWRFTTVAAISYWPVSIGQSLLTRQPVSRVIYQFCELVLGSTCAETLPDAKVDVFVDKLSMAVDKNEMHAARMLTAGSLLVRTAACRRRCTAGRVSIAEPLVDSATWPVIFGAPFQEIGPLGIWQIDSIEQGARFKIGKRIGGLRVLDVTILNRIEPYRQLAQRRFVIQTA
jgi:hypothetical protein